MDRHVAFGKGRQRLGGHGMVRNGEFSNGGAVTVRTGMVSWGQYRRSRYVGESQGLFRFGGHGEAVRSRFG